MNKFEDIEELKVKDLSQRKINEIKKEFEKTTNSELKLAAITISFVSNANMLVETGFHNNVRLDEYD